MSDPVATYADDPSVKKVLVISHERSGTHFLMNTIADNFGYVSNPWVDIDDTQVTNPYAWQNVKIAMENFPGPLLNIFKTHYSAGFFEGFEDWVLETFHVFYIRRETDPCMKSLMRHVNDLPWKAGLKTDDWLRFKWSPPGGCLLRYQMEQYDDMKSRHEAHIKGFTEAEPWASGAFQVSYEELDQEFERTVMKIACHLRMTPTYGVPVRPERGDRVINRKRIEELHPEFF